MSVSELRYHSNGVEASILRQRGGNDLHGFGKGSHAVGLHPGEALGVLHESKGHFNLRGSPTSYHRPKGEEGGGEETA